MFLPFGSRVAACACRLHQMSYGDMSATSAGPSQSLADRFCGRSSLGASRFGIAHEGVDLVAGERPVVVEIGDHLLHERLGEPDRPLFVAQLLEQDRERELLGTFPLIGPF